MNLMQVHNSRLILLFAFILLASMVVAPVVANQVPGADCCVGYDANSDEQCSALDQNKMCTGCVTCAVTETALHVVATTDTSARSFTNQLPNEPVSFAIFKPPRVA